ncbi:MAG: TolC family protein [Planctomycetales bacterium]|nr:TolC family protein [Planctomycetales bacterium]
MIGVIIRLTALAFPLLILAAGTGCRSRAEYVRLADRDAYCLIQQKSAGTPWSPPENYSLRPRPESRLTDDGCYFHPRLPAPTTALYAYELPLLRADWDEPNSARDAEADQEEQPVGRPIPPEAWAAIPKGCLVRMVDFDSIRREAEYTQTSFDISVFDEQASQARKLTLEDVVDLALLNSREYQTQKETLYLFALQLSQERFEYQRKFRANGNSASLGYGHNRFAGITENNLSIPSSVGMTRALVTGGDIVASFANNILLTFNGPAGFSKQVSSRLLFNFAQPLIQRDIQFESLTQAERDLVYAARNFARFRKQLFVSFASDYYSLIRSFRQIEIDSQNYFSLARTFNQAEQEFLAGQVPRFQVDQVEQNLLSGRGRLIGTCNQVEQSLDRLKIAIGIPTETPINIDLRELNELTRLDQLSVSADSASRVLERLRVALEKPDRIELLSTAAVLLDRIVVAASLSDESEEERQAYLRQRQQYLVDYARLGSQQVLEDLLDEVESESPSIAVVFERSMSHCDSLLRLAERQLDYAETVGRDSEILRQFEQHRNELAMAVETLDNENQTFGNDFSGVPDQSAMVQQANSLRERLTALTTELDQYLELPFIDDSQADLKRIVGEVAELVERASATLDGSSFGLKPIEINPDDAMLTALLLRFDLMNQRESLADDWRQIKLAADNLKAIINVNATQVINTDSNTNDPFNFTFDDSSTSLGLTVDAPLNRFVQRNNFRASLIAYQRALRNMSLLEDNIKFSIRNDLRNLALDREQYLIAVASAALAYERVVSTSLQFRLGTGGVAARDFLEAQTAYADALSNVAGRHIQYIVDRSNLFLDLELLTVDEDGFWMDIRNEDRQPEPVYSLPPWSLPVYGKLPCVWYSDEIRQMFCVPVYQPSINPMFTMQIDDNGGETWTATDSPSPDGE